jgi:hypothetical protein
LAAIFNGSAAGRKLGEMLLEMESLFEMPETAFF